MRYRSLLPNLAASALLLLGARNPVAVPRIADVKDVARKDADIQDQVKKMLEEIKGKHGGDADYQKLRGRLPREFPL